MSPMDDDVSEIRRQLSRAAIAGVYTTELGDLQHRSSDDLLLEAITGAVEDAGLTLADVDGIAGGRSASGSAGCSSVIGANAGVSRVNGSPNSVSLDAQTTRFTPSSVAALKTL